MANVQASRASQQPTENVDIHDTGNYRRQYVDGFVDKWDELIDWDRRARGEGSFITDKLQQFGVRSVLDVATGTGFHSVRLLEAGFDVVSADGSLAMLAKARENGKKRGHNLKTVHVDWRWLNREIHQKFDALICLGNSFTHVFSERERRKVLAEYYAVLKHDGVLLIDQRNYDRILDEGFSSKHVYYYCGKGVEVEPEYVDDRLARFHYRFPDDSLFYLDMFPLRKSYTRRLLQEVGFQSVETYGDFRRIEEGDESDFFIHVVEKAYCNNMED